MSSKVKGSLNGVARIIEIIDMYKAKYLFINIIHHISNVSNDRFIPISIFFRSWKINS